ncbi:blastula protease 10-like isoform X2 [Portunus trituberculatus]|uniref:blastula protease 10-like isoform X2 n=1 Tax=Portunus trituberculatus TaxID=210409 RepID=UPI001E1CFDBE|nr:blastula protease 10-like isoform X2 [Portunus trituberculatus]
MAVLLPTFLVSFFLVQESTGAPGQPQNNMTYEYSNSSAAPVATVVMGDMLVSQDLYNVKFNSSFPFSRKGFAFQSYLWPEEGGIPVVPYVFQDTQYQSEIETGIRHWEKHTCLIFRKKEVVDANWLRFINGNGCWAFIGKQPELGSQDVSIDNNCQKLSIVVHEIGHAIGLFHEQMRSDRDEHVTINWQNIHEGMKINFEKEKQYEDNRGVPYDYTSIMHYSGKAFNKNDRTTIATKLPEYQGLLGRTEELTHRDKHIVNLMYGCIDKWQAQCPSAVVCEGEGYLGRDCTCVCPPGREGDRCELQKAEYYDQSMPACSKTITTEINFTSPNYPHNMPAGTWCVYKVEAPVGMVPEVIFHSFSFLSPSISSCIDFLEVRDSSPYEGGVYCRREIKKGQSFVGNSTNLYLYMDISSSGSQGFEAEVVFHNASHTFKPKPGGVKNLVPSTVLVLLALLAAQVYGKF